LTRLARICAILLSGLAATALPGCVAPQTEEILASASARPSYVELTDVPFFPQERYQCGPASLAMMLAWSDVDITPDELTRAVYTPEREGSLPSDIVSAARRNGRVAIPVNRLDQLLKEIEAGHPVLVMQNLGLSWLSQWHFAVAVGYDLEQSQLILRSGTEERLTTPLDAFERTWARADSWAIIVLPPSAAPSAIDEASWVTSVAGFERAGLRHDALVAYRSVLTRYPDNAVARLGEANSLLALKQFAEAEAAYRRVLQRDRRMAGAWNNLAYALHYQRRSKEAMEAAQQALALAGGTSDVYADTLREVSQATGLQ
jgi:tetratricopeptide (TPR) repeat protein